MMEGRGAYIRIGLLIVGALAALIGLTIFLSGNTFNNGRLYETYFRESVQGLEVGAPVKYLGVTVGHVRQIGLVSAEYARGMPVDIRRSPFQMVFVRFVVDPARIGEVPSTAIAVQNGLRARVAQQGLTGLGYVELSFVNPAQYPPIEVPWKPRAEYIPSIPSTLSQVQTAAQDFLAKLNGIDIEAMITSVTDLVSDLRHSLRDGDAHTALAEAATTLASVREALQAAELEKTAADLRAAAASVRNLAQGDDMRALVANAATAAARMSAAAEKLPPLIATLQSTLRRTDNGAADLQQSLYPMLRDLQATLSNLRDTSEALRQYPASVLLGGPPPRTRAPSR